MMQVPTENDWSDPNTNPNYCADIRWAKEHFIGKTVEEAEELFIRNALHWQEAIMFMPSIPFRYYVHAYMNYLLDNQCSKGDTDGASCFLSLIESKQEWDQADLLVVWPCVKETIEHIRRNSGWFDWNESIYGHLEERTTQLLNWPLIAPDREGR